MKTLLAIDTHDKISGFLPAMWPHYEKAGVDILGVERTNQATHWPNKVETVAIGKDAFVRWCEHRHPRLLCDRMLDTFRQLLEDKRFTDYTDFCLSTWSILFTRPLPQPMPAPLVLWRTGLKQPGFEAPYFFHYPVWFNRDTGRTLLDIGAKLMDSGHNEQGANDMLFGLIVAKSGLEWFNAPAYSVNGLDTPDYIQEARNALHDGAWWIGNIKNEDQLKALLA